MTRRPSYFWRLVLVPLAAIGWSAPVAEAVPVTFDFTGRVVRLLLSTAGPIESLVHVGDPVLASLRYDTATPDVDDRSNLGVYIGPGSIKIRINGLVFKHVGDLTLLVGNDVGIPDSVFVFFAAQGSSSTPTRWPSQLLPLARGDLVLGWQEGIPLAFNPGQVLPQFLVSDALPVSASFFSIPGEGLIRGFTTPDSDASYVVAFDLAPVPEPATLLLVGTGAAGVGLARWIRRRRGTSARKTNP